MKHIFSKGFSGLIAAALVAGVLFALPCQAAQVQPMSPAEMAHLLTQTYEDRNAALWAEFTPGDGTELGNGRTGRFRTNVLFEMKFEEALQTLSDPEKKNMVLALHPSMLTAWLVLPEKEDKPDGNLRYAAFRGEDRINELTAAATETNKRIRVLPSLISEK